MNLPFKKSTSGLFITMYAFFAVFISSYVYADRSIPFAPAEVISPDCIPGSANCFVRATTLTGSNVVTSGTPTSVASPATLSASLTYNTSAGYPDNGYSHNYRVYAYKNTPAGRVYSPTYATLVTPQGTVGDPGNLQVTQVPDSSGMNTPNTIVNYHVYAFKDVLGGRVYSTNYATLTNDFTDQDLGSSYTRVLTWDPVPGATGYRILKFQFGVFNYDYGYDTVSNTLTETNPGLLWKSNASITTSSGILDQNQSQTVYTVNVSWDAVEGADGYRILKSNTNTNVGSGYYSGYGVIGSQNYDAGYDTTSTSLVDDACFSVCFDPTKGDVSQNSGYDNAASIQGLLNLSGPVLLSSNGYINWGGTAGSDGYGFRDHNGVMQYKDNGGSWISLSSVGGVKLNNAYGLVVGGGAPSVYHALFIGDNAGLLAPNATFSTFIGANAGNGATSADSSIFIGSNAGRDATNSTGSNFIGAGSGSAAVHAYSSNFIGLNTGDHASNASNSNFIGSSAGSSAAGASYSNFLGTEAGRDASGANNSNFFGYQAGDLATNAAYSNFIGANAGYLATNAYRSNFIGVSAGSSAIEAQESNFFGEGAGGNATSAYYSNFFGYHAGRNAANASASVFIGRGSGENASNALSSIFIGDGAGSNDTVDTSHTGSYGASAILIGPYTSTGGYASSIAIGNSATNTAINQFMIGSNSYPINTTVIKGASSTQCTITTGTGIACSSDINLKKNIEPITNAVLSSILALKPVTYNWKTELDTDPTHVGFIAQDVEALFPQAVSTDPATHMKLLSPTTLIPYTVKALQEMNLKIDDLSSLDTSKAGSLGGLMKDFLSNMGNGLDIVFFGEVHAKKLCLDDVCITKDQLKQILANQK